MILFPRNTLPGSQCFRAFFAPPAARLRLGLQPLDECSFILRIITCFAVKIQRIFFLAASEQHYFIATMLHCNLFCKRKAGGCKSLVSECLAGYHVFDQRIWPLAMCKIRYHNKNTGRNNVVPLLCNHHMMIFILHHTFPKLQKLLIDSGHWVLMQLRIQFQQPIKIFFPGFSDIHKAPRVSTDRFIFL